VNAATQIVEALLENREHVVAASIRSPSGKIYNDTNHGSAYMTAAEELGVDVDDIFASWDEGFLTNTGRFVDREEAYKIAMAAKQHRPAFAKDPNEPWLEYGEVEQDPRFFPKEMWPQQESVAVDLDGTLAKDSGWKGPEHIGEPIKPMLDLVRKLLDDGEEVVIFTARVHDGEKSTKDHIAQWLKDHDLPALEITNEKRPDMEKFYDDKAVAVEKNHGPSSSSGDGGDETEG
jgi:hypothetical protein